MDAGECTKESGPNKVSKKIIDGAVKGHTSYYINQGWKYATKINNSSKSCAVSVLDTTIKGKKNWVIRIDRPHPGKVPYNHININPKISGIKDPHLSLPPAGIQAAEGFTKCIKVVNKVALPIAVTMDTYRVASSAVDDYKNGTSRNTVETVANIGGTWGGGYGGAAGGAALGTALLPGVGTIIGGFVGGVAGGIGGSWASSKITEKVADKFDYDLEETACLICKQEFEWKKYLEKTPICSKCNEEIASNADLEDIICEHCQEKFKWEKKLEKTPICPKCNKQHKKDN